MYMGNDLGVDLISSGVGAAKSLVSSIFGGGTDLRQNSLNALHRAIKSGDVATIQRKAVASKYGRVRKESAAALLSMGLPSPTDPNTGVVLPAGQSIAPGSPATLPSTGLTPSGGAPAGGMLGGVSPLVIGGIGIALMLVLSGRRSRR